MKQILKYYLVMICLGLMLPAKVVFAQNEKNMALVMAQASPKMLQGSDKLRDFYSKNPMPVYPKLAREKGLQGKVILKVLVDPLGKVVDAAVEKSSGHRELDEAALEGIDRWKFRPAMIGNTPYQTWIQIPVTFQLREAGA